MARLLPLSLPHSPTGEQVGEFMLSPHVLSITRRLADPRSGKVTMMAHDKIYQHTMGNNVEPSFHDVFEMNLYYKCTSKSAAGRGQNCSG